MGLAKHLKKGRLIVNEEKRQFEIPQLEIVLPFDQLTNTDWG